jgi:hypothetical protein
VKSSLALPKSLQELNLRYSHLNFPKEEYVSRVAQLVDDIDPEMNVYVRLTCDLSDFCQHDHDGGYNSLLTRERRRVRSERIVGREESERIVRTEDELV